MRIVIDTNVFVGACIGVGASNAVIKACFEHRFTPLVGASLLADESDNHLIEVAVAGGAEFIVSRNLRDLKASELLFPGLRMISPEEFLKEL